ncbi:MAG: factor-independent urate hydroxylase [Sciscionella sp.]
MTIRLGPNQYGKAETRLVAISREGATHRLKDLNVSIALRGDLEDVHYSGDNSNAVPTDTQKNTVFAFAKQQPVGEIEDFALRLGRHFVSSFEFVHQCRVLVEEYNWGRITADGVPHEHAFFRSSAEIRTAAVTVTEQEAWVIGGLRDLVVLKSSGSEFWGYPKDRYTTLAETEDRILATALTARWRYRRPEAQWAHSFAGVRDTLLATFATKHSLSLQQSLYAMGEAALTEHEELAEIRMSMPNKHHFAVDLHPFGLTNDNEVFFAADRPYGLIEGTVLRDDAEDPGSAWYSLAEF